MKKFDLETELNLTKLENDFKEKIYNKYFKDRDDIEESILAGLKKQIFKLAYIYVYLGVFRKLLTNLQKTNSSKIIKFYDKHLLNIYKGIDFSMESFCNMADQMQN